MTLDNATPMKKFYLDTERIVYKLYAGEGMIALQICNLQGDCTFYYYGRNRKRGGKMIISLDKLPNVANRCIDFYNDIIGWIYDDSGIAANQLFCYTPRYKDKIVKIERYLEAAAFLGHKPTKTLQQAVIRLQEPKLVQDIQVFARNMNHIIAAFKSIRLSITKKLKKMRRFEIRRLSEALCCYFEGCYTAAVALSVSAVEYRLSSLLVKNNPGSATRLNKMTLGQLISEYLNNKSAYKNIISKKHESLLILCNTYRIFSVHPTKEQISESLSLSILNLSFNFLLDKKLKP